MRLHEPLYQLNFLDHCDYNSLYMALELGMEVSMEIKSSIIIAGGGVR